MLCTELGVLDTSRCHSLQCVVFNTCTPAVVCTSLIPKAHGNFYKRPFYLQFHTGAWRLGCNQTLLYSELLTTSTTLKGECGLTVQHLCQLLCNHMYHNTVQDRQLTALRVRESQAPENYGTCIANRITILGPYWLLSNSTLYLQPCWRHANLTLSPPTFL